MQIRKTLNLIMFILYSGLLAWSQSLPEQFGDPASAHPVEKVQARIEEAHRMVLAGHLHPMATAANMVGEVPSSQSMGKMVLVLAPDASQEAALEELIHEQQDPSSPYYHQWLTPEEFGERFGIA